MDSSQRALQNDGKLFFFLKFRFQIFGRKPKIFQKNSEAKKKPKINHPSFVNISPTLVIDTSMEISTTTRKLFFFKLEIEF